MGFLSRLSQNRRAASSVGTVTVFSLAVVGLAVLYQGEATADVELNDSGVWVTNASAGLVGRFNSESQALDGTLLAGSASFDVQQDAADVLVDDSGSGIASPVDVAHLTLDGQVRLPANAEVASSGGVAAIVDNDKHRLWVLPFDSATSFDPQKSKPLARLGGEGVVTVSQQGTVFVAVPSTGKLWTVQTADDGTVDGKPSTDALSVDKAADVQVTAVGEKPVVLDRSGGQVVLPKDKTVQLEDAAEAEVQQPSADSTDVVVATASGLVSQPLGGGDATTRSAQGTPAAPVQLDGCTYGAWGQSGQVLRDCAGTDRDVDKRLDGLDPQAPLAYRVNRHVVVLNDLAAGTVWMAADNYQMVDDWDLTEPNDAKGEESDASETNPEQVDQFLADRSKKNRDPIPEDDTLGARPGRTTILPVLANDVDPDGDVMTASVLGEVSGDVEVQQIMGGAALQAVVPQDATGSTTFQYAVSDGRGGHGKASVTLKISPTGKNASPVKLKGDPVLRVEQGKSASIKVLPYFKDPDGDDLYLASAESTVEGDDVRFRPDGTVEFRDGGTSTGRKIVKVVVADGLGGVVDGKLLIDVVAGAQPPIAVNDHVTVVAGQSVTVSPLDNDTDPNGDELRLSEVSESAPATITPNQDAGTFTFLSQEPGSYDVTYKVTDGGPDVTTGLVRVDVTAPDDASGAPVVVTDTAMLPVDGETLVDVLANDSDPAGGVLVVQSVQVPDDAGVSVAVLAHRVLRITPLRALDGGVTVQYTASNGTDTATGQVRVMPVPAPTKLQPPNARADEVTVHTGDVVTIPVLKNDTHPDGLELTLEPELEQGTDPALGEAFVSEDTVRFKAGSKAGTAYAIYKVSDPNGQEDSAQVTVRIRDGQDNTPPVPRDVEARVLSGASTTVDIPLDGIDPDGDSVELSGIASAPGKGTATLQDGVVRYTAGKGTSGLDTFGYTVLDARGKTATGTVRVGIAPPADENQSPVALDDQVTVRPDRTVAVAALANDTDPDGDQIALVPSELEGTKGMEPEVEGDRVVVTTPAEEGSYTFYYAIQDTYGARATGAITLDVAKDAPLLPPVARDDVVPTEAVLGETSVPVDVLENDDDPDGAASELTVSSEAENVTVGDDGTLDVTLSEHRQVITYTVTDVDGLTAKAFVTVPGKKSQAPTLRPGIDPLEVQSGESLDIDISDYVVVSEGRTPRLTTEDQVKATEGSREVTSKTDITYTPDADYTGPAAVSFEVTDGSGPDDPDANSAVLSLPIKVLPPKNLPPEFTTTPTLDVAAGEEATIDLSRFATDPDGDDLKFTAASTGKGVTVSLDGSTLHAQADADTPKGSAVQVPVTVTDGEHPPVDGQATLTVVASTRPLARANPDSVDDAHQGKATTVNVLANDSNPFPDTPLKLTEAIVETGEGDSAVDGDSVTVTPRDDFVGAMVVRYRVQDATTDPDREVEGVLKLTVLGKPDAPTTPQVEEVRSETVVLTWDPPNNNGAPITGYTATSQNGYSKDCGTTTCTLDGLKNDVKYRFTVAAKNDVGTGPESPASAEARPDEKPDAPSAPKLKFGDKQLTVTWENKTYTDRSAITCVNLRISPAPAGGSGKTCVKGTSTVWTGLTNGTSYTVEVQATNKAPDPSEWGARSAAEIPAGKPAKPGAPKAARSNDNVNGGVIGVTWSAPDGNGDAAKTYYLQRYKGGKADGGAVKVTKTSYTATGLDNEATYSFAVTGENKAGKSPASGQSSTVIPYGKPGAPGKPTAALISKNTSGKASVKFAKADANGNAVTYEVQANGSGGTTKKTSATSYTFTGLKNGSAYTFQVRACNAAGCSGWTAKSGSVTPYTTPGNPGAKWTKSGAQDGYFTVTKPGSDGGNKTTVTWTLSGSQSKSGKTVGRVDVSGGYSKSYKLTVKACNKAGCTSATASGATEAKPVPKKSIAASKGSNHKLPDSNGWPGHCQVASCAEVYLTIKNAAPNKSFTVTCYGGGTKIGSGGYVQDARFDNLKTDSNGNYSGGQQCIWGNPGTSVYVQTSIGKSTSTTWN